jgi:hypothetical protein
MLDRRTIIAAWACFMGMHVVRSATRTALARETAVPVYHVDLDELVKAFPRPADSSSLPPLLDRFGKWMAGKPWRSIGAFDLAVQWSDIHFAGGEFHYDQFALFMRMPDGSSVGYWLADRDLAHARLTEAEALKPHLATLRDEAATKAPGVGLWHRATLMVYKDNLELMTDYLFEPDFRSDRPSAADFKADQTRAPRAVRRVSPWLAMILAP